jgi:HK97 family phage major capsid protein
MEFHGFNHHNLCPYFDARPGGRPCYSTAHVGVGGRPGNDPHLHLDAQLSGAVGDGRRGRVVDCGRRGNHRTDATLDELDITPSKLAALSVISSELANDSTSEAAQAVGDSIVRDLARKVDTALFTATTTNGPGGLPGVSGVTSVSGPATDYANVDPFSDAVYSSAAANGTITSGVTNPATAKKLAKLNKETGSNEPLLGPDPTMPGRQQILGIPLVTAPGVTTTNNVIWGIPQQYAYFVVRQDAQVESDRSVFFTSDRVAVRATLRVGFGFPSPAAIVKIATT